MKTPMRLVFIPFVAAILALGCSKDKADKTGEAYLVVKGKTVDIVPTKANIPLSEGVNLGIYAKNVSSGSTETLQTSIVANRLLSVGAGGGVSGDAIYLKLGKDYDVYAYAPRVTSPADPATIPFTHGTDLLWAGVNETLRGVDIGENPVNMSFVHKMAQIKFALADDRDQEAKDTYPFSGASFEVTGFYRDFTLNLETGTVNLATIDNSIKITQQNNPVCFAPALNAMNLAVKVTIPGVTSGEQVYTGIVSSTFLQGNSYSFNIKISTTSLSISGTITDWVPVSGDDIIVTPSVAKIQK